MNGKTCLFVCLLAFTTLYSCQQKGPDTKVLTLSVQDTISLQTFESWTKAWISDGQAFMDSSLIQYFTMPLIDLKEVSNEDPAAARFYLGLDTTVTPFYPHLLLVGVDSNGRSLLDYSLGQYVYDVTSPCPPACER